MNRKAERKFKELGSIFVELKLDNRKTGVTSQKLIKVESRKRKESGKDPLYI